MKHIEPKKQDASRVTLPLLNFNGRDVRIEERNGGIWFYAQELCRAVDIKNTSDAVSRLDPEDRGIVSTDTPSGIQDVIIVSEAGMYNLVLGSRKPQAKAFKKWVTSEVLPSIRKTGAYTVAPAFALPSNMAEALRLAADTIEQRDAALLQLEEAAPKIEFHDTVTASNDVVLMAVAVQTAKLGFGQNILFRKLREMGVLISGGKRHNLPKQAYVEQGLFTVNEFKFKHNSGDSDVSFTTYVTQKGIAWLIKTFKPQGALQQEGLLL